MNMSYHGAGVLCWYQKEKGDKVSVLLGLRCFNPDKNKWSIPGGGYSKKDGLFKGEPNYMKTAQRELREETGFNVTGNISKFLRRIWTMHVPFFNYEVFALKCKQMHKVYGKAPSAEEFIQTKWFDIDDLPDHCEPLLLKQVESLRKVLEEKEYIF